MRIILSVFLLMMLVSPLGANAQEAAEDSVATKLNLAKIMHEIKPARGQIETAIEMVARRLPSEQQQGFVERMNQVFDYKELEELSIQSMAEVFTQAELEKMVDYYGSKEAMSINEKMTVYQSVMQPEITKMLDEAIIEARTGGPSDIAPSDAPAPATE
jgi:hypothetical protein